MTVAEIIEELKTLDQDASVRIAYYDEVLNARMVKDVVLISTADGKAVVLTTMPIVFEE